MLKNSLIVGLGGSIGALSRFLLSEFIPFSFPIATLLANSIGSFLLGFAITLSLNKKITAQQFLLFGTGFCGGLTTLSTFTKETVQLWYGFPPFAFLYILLSGTLGLIAVYFGMKVGQTLGRSAK